MDVYPDMLCPSLEQTALNAELRYVSWLQYLKYYQIMAHIIAQIQRIRSRFGCISANDICIFKCPVSFEVETKSGDALLAFGAHCAAAPRPDVSHARFATDANIFTVKVATCLFHLKSSSWLCM